MRDRYEYQLQLNQRPVSWAINDRVVGNGGHDYDPSAKWIAVCRDPVIAERIVKLLNNDDRDRKASGSVVPGNWPGPRGRESTAEVPVSESADSA